MNYQVSIGKDEYDPGVVQSATCEVCHTKHATVPAKRPKCVICEREGCPECEHQVAMTSCDHCDDVICYEPCSRVVFGSRICLKVNCRTKAVQAHEEYLLAQDARKKQDRWGGRRAS